MTREDWQTGTQRSTPSVDPFPQLCSKVVLLVTEDRFVLSHLRPLIAVLEQIAHSVVVVTHTSDRREELEALGARVVHFDFQHASSNPSREAAAAWALARILEDEGADVVHLVAMRPIVLGALALKLMPAPHTVVHMPGLDLLGFGARHWAGLYRLGALRLIASMLRKPSSYLLVETSDDLARVRAAGLEPGARFAILGGVGVDPETFPAEPPPVNDVPIAAFVGRVTHSNGLDVLVRALGRLKARSMPIRIELYGSVEDGGAEAISADIVKSWGVQADVSWFGPVSDVRDVWRRADIFVLPARSREGMPRALLEAAACARPLVVTDVPGCRHFVRDGVEGLVVPPEDAEALANALELLARDPDMRVRMGEAARLRLLQGYTEAHVRRCLLASYTSMLGNARPL